jgi:hypothetical protein
MTGVHPAAQPWKNACQAAALRCILWIYTIQPTKELGHDADES